MSRLGTLSPAALKAMFSPESSDTLITLLTISGSGITSPIYLADGYTKRISETADEVIYGVTSNSVDYTFLPIEITLPSEEQDATPRCSLTIHDVTRYLTPIIRSINQAPSVNIKLVLNSSPNVIEAEFDGLLMSGISYNASTVTAELTVESMDSEPFPAHTCTPSYFPGLF